MPREKPDAKLTPIMGRPATAPKGRGSQHFMLSEINRMWLYKEHVKHGHPMSTIVDHILTCLRRGVPYAPYNIYDARKDKEQTEADRRRLKIKKMEDNIRKVDIRSKEAKRKAEAKAKKEAAKKQ